MTNFGKMTISEAVPYLNAVAQAHGLKLNRVFEFKIAKRLLINLYCNEWA